jgi:hypothetical protein
MHTLLCLAIVWDGVSQTWGTGPGCLYVFWFRVLLCCTKWHWTSGLEVHLPQLPTLYMCWNFRCLPICPVYWLKWGVALAFCLSWPASISRVTGITGNATMSGL